MPRLLLPLSVLAIALGCAFWVGVPRASEVLPPPAEAVKKQAFTPIGVSGCTATACHGETERGKKGSEYSTWIAVDPHAKAYNALYKPESVRMHTAMKRPTKAAHLDPLCLQCHGMGEEAPEAIQSDGVGCERCHGNASEWKSTHYLGAFDRTRHGFVDLRKMPARVESCVKCHVGEGSMEVDHDLIAAGHPRLRFEFAAYYSNYPRHWAETPQNKHDGDEVRGWLLGQIVSARGAADLLAHRAASKPDSWPEFAEYDCAACHHGLEPKNFRTDRDLKLAEAKPKEKIPLGRLPWGTWYDPLLPALAAATKADRAELDASFGRLRGLMTRSRPDKAKVRREADALSARLRIWEKAVAGPAFVLDTPTLMKALAGRPELARAGWDGGAQVYLGLAALNYDLPKPTPFLSPLRAMRKDLAGAYPENPRPRYDVPSRYDPKPLVEGMKTILADLEKDHAPRD